MAARAWSKAETNERASRHHRNRKRAAEELVSTERSYVRSLDIMCDHFYEPMLKALKRGKPILSKKDINTLFADISTLRHLNKKFLTDLKKRVDDYSPSTQIGDILLDFSPYFKMYRQYVENTEKPRSKELVKLLDKKGSAFAKFCNKVTKQQKCLPLPALLITPVQRIPRYRLLVREYIKLTADVHPDYPKLQKALEEIKKTATFVNDSIRKSQNRIKIIQVSKLFAKDPLFIAPSRIYRFDGKLKKKSRKGDKLYRFFLFNDLLAYAHEDGSRCVLHNRIPVDSNFEVREANGQAEPHSFQIVNSVKSFQVYAKTAEDKKQWIAALNSVIQEYKNERSELHEGDSKEAKAVLQSRAQKTCQRQRTKKGMPCATQFGLFAQRHNCHKCGILCCDKCSPYRVFTDIKSYKKERVCTVCITALMKLPRNMKLYKLRELPPPDTPAGSYVGRWNDAQENDSSRGKKANSIENLADRHGLIKITLVKASEIPVSTSCTPEPIVIWTTSSNLEVESKSAGRSFNPVWNQDLTIHVENLQEELKIEMLDKRSLDCDSFGSAVINISNLTTKPEERQIILYKNEKSGGIIHFKICFKPAYRNYVGASRRASVGSSTFSAVNTPNSPKAGSRYMVKVTAPPGETPALSKSNSEVNVSRYVRTNSRISAHSC
mmetsp:Transcript_11571/g.17276  ORF Transcript_11571/g.17276 Transcript_11571/m.17276 type:complete len:664 (+) Transcript_11571:56-2047(+)